MKIAGPKGNEVTTLEQWGQCVRKGHFRRGRSAYALADFILNRNGAGVLASRLSAVLSKPVEFKQATLEYRAKFDSYRGNPSNLDLAVWGRAGATATLFLGVEAKVDEPFNNETVCERYRSAVQEQRRNPRSKAVNRVSDLVQVYFADSAQPCDSRLSDIRYQLLTGTAGTVATEADESVFYVSVFKTGEYDEAKGQANRSAYERFLKAAGAKSLSVPAENTTAHQLQLNGRRLVCIWEWFDAHEA